MKGIKIIGIIGFGIICLALLLFGIIFLTIGKQLYGSDAALLFGAGVAFWLGLQGLGEIIRGLWKSKSFKPKSKQEK